MAMEIGAEAKKKAPRKPGAAVNGSTDNGVAKPKSRRGCITCKAKRLKCDEEKPGCQQCARRNVECGGYKIDPRWRPFRETNVKVHIRDDEEGRQDDEENVSTEAKSVVPGAQPCKTILQHLRVMLRQLRSDVSFRDIDEGSGLEDDVDNKLPSSWSNLATDESHRATTQPPIGMDQSIPAISTCQSNGLSQPASGSTETGSIKPSTINSKYSTSGSEKEPGKGNEDAEECGEDEDSGKKSSGGAPDPDDLDEDKPTKRHISCIEDDCNDSFQYMSYLRRHTHVRHSFSYCAYCCLSIQNQIEYSQHGKEGSACSHHCISSKCHSTANDDNARDISKRRHKRDPGCPPLKIVSVTDRWQHLYHSRYPERIVPKPYFGPTDAPPNRTTEERAQYKGQRQISRIISLEEKVAQAEADIEEIRRKTILQNQTELSKLDQLINQEQFPGLEKIIIVGLLELWPADVAIPRHLLQLIERVVPDANVSTMAPRHHVSGKGKAREEDQQAAPRPTNRAVDSTQDTTMAAEPFPFLFEAYHDIDAAAWDGEGFDDLFRELDDGDIPV